MQNNLCLFSVGYAGFWGQATLPLQEFIERAGRLGYGSVMLLGKRPHLSPLDYDPAQVAVLREVLQHNKVACKVVAAYTDLNPNPTAGEIPVIEQQILYVEQLAKLAAGLDPSPTVRVFTAYDHGALSSAWDRVVQAIRECCDRATPHHATIAIQNHHDLAVDSEALLELHANVDRANCKLAFDAWSPAMRGEDLYLAAKRAARHTVISTNADYLRFPSYRYDPSRISYDPSGHLLRAVPFGEGFIDYDAFWKGMADGGYSGICGYEMCSPLRGGGSLSNLDDCAASYVDWMKAHHPNLVH